MKPRARRTCSSRLVGASLAVLLYATHTAQAAPTKPDVLRVQRAEIVDRQGFEKPMVAATLMVPAGWTSHGEVQWNIGRQCGKPYGLQLLANAPEGAATIELAPMEAWGATSTGAPLGDCPQAVLRDAREYLASWIDRHRNGARLVEYRPRPDRSRTLGRNEGSGMSLHSWIDSGQARIAYRRDGREVHELLVASVNFTQSRVAAGAMAFESLQGQALGVLGWRSTSGPVSQRHFDLMWASLKTAPEWQARISAAEQQMAADNAATQARIARMQAESSREALEHIRRRGEIRNEAMQETARMRNETWRSGQATQDRMHRESVRTIREVQGYRDPRNGGVVELPHHYDHAWQLRDGSYVLTDDPDFDPRRDLGVAGEALQRTRE